MTEPTPPNSNRILNIRLCANSIRPSSVTYSRRARQCHSHISTRQQENESQLRPCRVPWKVVAEATNVGFTLAEWFQSFDRTRPHQVSFSACAYAQPYASLECLGNMIKRPLYFRSMRWIFLIIQTILAKSIFLFSSQTIHLPTINHGQRRI